MIAIPLVAVIIFISLIDSYCVARSTSVAVTVRVTFVNPFVPEFIIDRLHNKSRAAETGRGPYTKYRLGIDLRRLEAKWRPEEQ